MTVVKMQEKQEKNEIMVVAIKSHIIQNGKTATICSTSCIEHLDDDNHLKDMYRIIDCRCVDIRQVEIKGNYYDVWFDDEFLLTDKPPIPTLLLPYDTLICGNVLFAKSNEEGETIGLSYADVEIINNFVTENRKKAVDFMNKIIIRNRAV